MMRIEKETQQDLEATESYNKTQLGKIKFSNSRSARLTFFDKQV